MIAAMPIRKLDWEMRLHEFIESRKGSAFAWGSNDCCLFAADAVEAMTGVDLAANFRGKYDSEASCVKMVSELGYASIEDLIRKELASWQLQPMRPVQAHRGDLLLTMQEGQPALCVVGLTGKHSIGVGEDGLMKVRTYHDGVVAYRVPYVAGVQP